MLPASYTNAFAFAGPRTEFAKLGDEYACAMRRACQLGKPPGPSPSPKTSWGKIIAQCLRQPLLAEKMGLLFETDVAVPAASLANGGYVLHRSAARQRVRRARRRAAGSAGGVRGDGFPRSPAIACCLRPCCFRSRPRRRHRPPTTTRSSPRPRATTTGFAKVVHSVAADDGHADRPRVESDRAGAGAAASARQRRAARVGRRAAAHLEESPDSGSDRRRFGSVRRSCAGTASTCAKVAATPTGRR